jgi:anti-sigma regulatory factor (Ser/Thr protein kinase)
VNVITVPTSLDDQTFEHVLEQLALLPPDARVLFDARFTTWASPFGLTALLTLAQTFQTKPQLMVPDKDDTVSYWARTRFFEFAADLFELSGKVPAARNERESGTLLEITPVVRSDDVHTVVERIKDKAAHIITQNLHLESRAVMGFAMTLSEACQNIVEHAGRGGWVAVQNYHYKKRLGRHVVQIAVCDAGMGIRLSLESGNRRPLTERWDDGVALETAVIQGTSRFPDHGRGQGFKGIRGYLNKWQGKISVRSGTSRVAMVPSWDDDLPRRDGLPNMAGTQLLIMIPEKSEK